VHETGYTIRILFCTVTYTKALDLPNFENVVAPLRGSKNYDLYYNALEPCLKLKCTIIRKMFLISQ